MTVVVRETAIRHIVGRAGDNSTITNESLSNIVGSRLYLIPFADCACANQCHQSGSQSVPLHYRDFERDEEVGSGHTAITHRTHPDRYGRPDAGRGFVRGVDV